MTPATPYKTCCAGGHYDMPSYPASWFFDLLTLKVVSESHVTWATSVPILVFLGLSLTDVRRASSLNAPYPRGGGIKPKECASSAGDNKQNVRRVRNCRGISVQTVLSLAISWMSGATARRWRQPAGCSPHGQRPRERRGYHT